MKRKSFCCICLFGFLSCCSSCCSDRLDSNSIFQDDSSNVNNVFDTWLYAHYVKPYNIELQYHLKTIETDYAYTLVPADYDKSVQLAHIILYAWIDAYNQIAGLEFTKKYVPKVLQLVGSPLYSGNGITQEGSTQGGMKVTLYNVNALKLDRAFLQENFIKTMHHEFVHVLLQQVSYDKNFDKITAPSYVNSDWYKKKGTEALAAGFVTPYAMSEPIEDFAETMAAYLVSTTQDWSTYLAVAGPTGSGLLQMKLQSVKDYMANNWAIDMDKLRAEVLVRIDDIVNGKVDLVTL